MSPRDIPGLVLYALVLLAVALKCCETCQSQPPDDVHQSSSPS